MQLVDKMGATRIDTVSSLAEILSRVCPSADIKDTFLASISTTHAHIRELEMWFQAGVGAVSAESVVREVRLYQASGVFIGRTPRHEAGGGLELEHTVGESVLRQSSDGLLQTLLSAVFSCGEELPGGGAAVLLGFIEAHGAAEDAVVAIGEAEAAGLPYVQQSSLVLGRVADPAALRAFAAAMRRKANEWKNVIKIALERTPRLQFLDRTQMLMFMRLVGAVTAAHPVSGIPQFPKSHIRAYVAMCFPDVVGGDGGEAPLKRLARTAAEMVESEFEAERDSGDDIDGGASEHKGGDGATRDDAGEMASVRRTLAVCVSLVQGTEAALVAARAFGDAVELADVTKDNVEVLMAIDSSPVKIYDHILSVFPALPHACQLKWCSAATTEEAVMDFVERARCLSQLCYVLIGVDRLPSSARERLLRALVDDEVAPRRIGRLTLVFTAHAGSEGFRFLQQADGALRCDVAKIRAKFAASGAESAFGTRVLLCGRANGGKSWRARHILAEKCCGAADSSLRMRTLAVHESFSAMDAATWYVSAAKSGHAGDIGIHVNVLTFRLAHAHELESTVSGPVNDVVAQALLSMMEFLHNLIASGLIVDADSGIVTSLDWSRGHHLVVELPAVPGWTAESGSPHFYLAHLSSGALGFSVESVTWLSVPIFVDDVARLVAWFWRERSNLDTARTLPDKGSEDPCSALSPAAVVAALNDMWGKKCPHLEPVHNTRREHVKLMHERCIFIARLKAEQAVRIAADGGVGQLTKLTKLFDLLLAEATQLKDGTLVNDWFRIDGFSCRPMPIAVTGGTGGVRAAGTSAGDSLYHYTTFELLYLNTTDRKRAERAALGIPPQHVTVALPEAASDGERSVFAAGLRLVVARSLGVTEATLQRCVQAQSFCLIPEFCVRLLVLHEFVRIGTSVILSGETGTGKTEVR